jgi:threonine dehydratase
MASALTFEHIEQARARMGDRITRTPFAEGHNLSAHTGARLWFKLENLQITGSFKERGALNKLLTLTDAERSAGVVAASAGNHAQGVALHARNLGIDATIVMPEGTPLMKVQRTRRYGARIVLHGANYDEAYKHACMLCEAEGRTFVHAFDDLAVMAGQGTLGLELLEQNPYIQTLVVPVGGGGLISGVAVAVKETNPRIRVVGVQSAAYPSMRRALDVGHPVEIEPGVSIADGIAVRRAGDLTLATVAQYVDDVVTVEENEIANAILLLLEEEKVVAEGAAGAGLAAVLGRHIPDLDGRRTGVIVCGGNIDTNLMSNILDRGLVSAGRRVRLVISAPDVPGSLARIAAVVAQRRANILEIHHEREFVPLAFAETQVTLTLETRGPEHIADVVGALEAQGWSVQVPGGAARTL